MYVLCVYDTKFIYHLSSEFYMFYTLAWYVLLYYDIVDVDVCVLEVFKMQRRVLFGIYKYNLMAGLIFALIAHQVNKIG